MNCDVRVAVHVVGVLNSLFLTCSYRDNPIFSRDVTSVTYSTT